MEFKDFIEKGSVRIASKDIELAKSLVRTSGSDIKFLNGLEINENSARKLMVNYYDVLRSILEAITCLEGYKIYSHEAYVYFLKEKSEDVISTKFDRFRKIRNSINYYGENVEVEEVKENIKEIKEIVSLLINKYLGDIGVKNE